MSGASTAATGPTTAQTQYGAVIGQQSGNICVFKGMPYAAPPTGSLRFRPPQPPQSWESPFDATSFGAAPMQIETPALGPIGAVSEDCLTLNVWAPAAPGPHPVMVWVYGGANTYGATSETTYDGTHFAQAGIVVVTVNYRLGAFGFLELGSVLPGYGGSSLNGLRDLVAALHWVSANISGFGGDPANVSLIGQSAGAKNACALMAIPAARGLFHRAAILSGGGHTAFATIADSAPVMEAFLAAAELDKDIAEALLTLPGAALLAAQGRLLQSYQQGFVFRPTVDGAFMPTRPIDAARAGQTASVDLLTGTCRDEAATLILLMGMADKPLEPKQIGVLDPAQMAVAEARYADHFPQLSAADRRIRALSAEEYWIPSVEFAAAHASAGGTTHMFRFDQPASVGPLQNYAGHGADLPYLWTPGETPKLFRLFGPPDEPLRQQMLEMWGDWAKTGAVTLRDAPEWQSYALPARRTMLIKSDCEMVGDPAGDERGLWADMGL